MSLPVTLLYFASLRDAAGVGQEVIATDAVDLSALYRECAARHGFALPQDRMRVAVDGAFCDWAMPVVAGSEVAFIPPVSGG